MIKKFQGFFKPFLFFTFLLISSTSAAVEVNDSILPIEITPESLKAFIQKNVPFILVNSDDPISVATVPPPEINTIYYTLGLSKAGARKAATQDRQAKKLHSQVLTGTPLEWDALDLPIRVNISEKKLLKLSPKTLAQALKDSEDILIIDLRDSDKTTVNSLLFKDKIVNLLPHQVKDETKNISKFRWTVLMDDGQGVADYVAEELLANGYVLVGVLDGGYPAWIAETNK